MPQTSSLYGNLLTLAFVVLLGVPSIVLFTYHIDSHPLVSAAVFGVGILAGAFLLSWAAEVAELDISASLAIAILALLTVLPEYVIEAVLAWDAGASFDLVARVATEETDRVAANVTGAIRLLIGFGWAAVILIYWLRARKPLDLKGMLDPELPFMALATVLTLAIFARGEIHVLLAVVLIAVYAVYLWKITREEGEAQELVGVSAWLGSLPVARRRAAVLLLLAYATVVIVVAADPFVESLVESGRNLGIDDFILIQWIAPLASETPEVLVAVLFSLRSRPAVGIAILISSEVSKLTLLIGSMVVIFSISAGEILSFPLNLRQADEFLLTTAAALFGLALLARRRADWKGGALLLALFIAQLFFPDREQRFWFAIGYFALAGLILALDWRRLPYLVNEKWGEAGESREDSGG